jgi:hypothetical protein
VEQGFTLPQAHYSEEMLRLDRRPTLWTVPHHAKRRWLETEGIGDLVPQNALLLCYGSGELWRCASARIAVMLILALFVLLCQSFW